MIWLTQLFCKHRLWEAMHPVAEYYPDHYAITWEKMVCTRCGKIREDNVLKPGEEVIVPWQGEPFE